MKLKFWAAALALVGGVFLTTSCDKTPETTSELGEMSFKIANASQNFGKKDASPKDQYTPECSTESADYARVLIEDGTATQTWYTLDLLSLGDGESTEVLQLPAGTYTVLEFLVYNDLTGDGFTGDDELIYASPAENSYYDLLFNFEKNVPDTFTLEPFEKEENVIDVLCYTPAEYDKFGFKHFKYHPYQVHEVCFYGDICTKFWEEWRDYDGKDGAMNPYKGWPEHYDLYGVFSVTAAGVDAQGNAITLESNNFDVDINADDFTPESLVVCVEFLDNMWVDGEIWTFTVNVKLPDGSIVPIGTTTISDDPDASDFWENYGGEDGIYTWALGDCNYTENEIELIGDAVLFLPETVTANIKWVLPADEPHFQAFDIIINSMTGSNQSLYPDELVIGELMGGYCGDINNTIGNGDFTFDVYRTDGTYAALVPTYYIGYPLAQINWLVNQDEAVLNSGAGGNELQALLWMMIHDGEVGLKGKIQGYLPSIDDAKYADLQLVAANALTHTSFVPRTGDWTALLFDPQENGDQTNDLQLLVVRVDP